MRRFTALRLCLALLFMLLESIIAPHPASAASGSISGRVTAADTGLGMAGVSIGIYRSADQIWAAQGSTAADGSYNIPNIAPDQYIVTFSPASQVYLYERYNNRHGVHPGDTITVGDGQAVSGIDAVLERTGTISGRVTAADTGLGMPFVEVSFYIGTTRSLWVYTDANGNYTSPGPLDPELDYAIGFDPPDPYNTTYSGGADTLAGATRLRVAPASAVTANASVVRTGVISGQVTASDSGAPLANVAVRIYIGSASWYWQELLTDSSGRYTTTEMVPNGPYVLEFIPPSTGVASAYFGEFYNNVATLAQATPVVVAGGTTTTANAVLQRGATISGRVTRSDGGAGLPGVSVMINGANNAQFYAQSDSTGAYSTTQPIPAGSYEVCFLTSGTPAERYFSECYDNRPASQSAPRDLVVVAAGQNRTGINAVLQRSGAISGRVTTADTGQPIAGAEVRLYDSSDAQLVLNYATTSADGSYAIGTWLSTASYLLEVRPLAGPYLREFFDGRASANDANVIQVTAGLTTTTNVTLDRGGALAGRVTGVESGAGLADVEVAVYDATGARVASATTSGGGDYVTDPPLRAGAYRVAFTPVHTRVSGEFGEITTYGSAAAYVSAFSGGGATIDDATPVIVALGATTTANATLQRGATISGHVTSAAFGPLAGAIVRIYDDCAVLVSQMRPDPTGAYTSPALTAGAYRVEVAAAGHRTWFSGGATSLDAAAPITVAPPGNVVVDAALATGAVLSGEIRIAETGEVAVANVAVYDAAGTQVASTTTYNGAYSIGNLASGRYRVKFSYIYAGVYPDVYYGGATSLDAATPIDVPPGGLSNINGLLPIGGRIAGEITGAGTLLNMVTVRIYDAAGNLVSKVLNYSGAYSVGGLPPGTYRLYYDTTTSANGTARDYASAFYPNVATLAAATPLQVIAGQTTTANVALTRGGTISGRVTDSDSGDALASGAPVLIYDAAGAVVDETYTRPDGAYESHGLPAGAYRVGVHTGHVNRINQSFVAMEAGEYYGGARSLASATPVLVSLAANTPGIDVAIEKGGLISGSVYAEGEGGLGERIVRFYDAGGALVGTASTNYVGQYISPALIPGSYRVQFSDDIYATLQRTYTMAPEYHSNRALLSEADSVTVVAGRVTSVSATLRRAEPICGRVTAENGGAALAGVQVDALSASGGVMSSATSDAAGRYTLMLAPGSYRVRFTPGAAYLPEYYANQASLAAATSVAAGSAGIDAALGRGAQFSGTVTTADLLPDKRAGLAAAGGVAGVTVRVYDAAGQVVASGVTGADGSYLTAPGLPPGSYRLGFAPPAGSGFAPTFFPLKSGLADAAAQEVTAPGIVTPSAERLVFLPVTRR